MNLRLLAILIVPALAFAQFDKGQLAGIVRDGTNQVIPNATVTATQSGNGLRFRAETGMNGAWTLAAVPAGNYEVAVEAAGFKRFVRPSVKVDAATRTSVEAILELGVVTETVTVTEQTAQLQQETAQIGRVVEARQITDLALNGRNPINLALLKAGVVGGNFNSFNSTSLGQSFSINGGRGNGNNVTMDGVPAVRTRGDGGSAALLGVFNVDTIQEVQILTSTYPAEYGRAMDGQVRFVSKSGTRDFHGTASHYLRNSALDANTWTRNRSTNLDESRRAAPFRFNQPGYSIGGPVFIPRTFNTSRDRLFFFVSQEWIRFRQESTSTGTVPSAAMRLGDFSELLSPTNSFFRRVLTIRDPNSGVPFPNNIIPTTRLSRNGMAVLRSYPMPVPGFLQGTANWIQSRPNPRNQRKDMFRVDFYTGRHRMSFSGQNYSYFEDAPFRGNFDVANTRWDRPNRTGAFSVATTVAPTLINEFTVTAANDVVRMTLYPTAGETLYDRTRYGFDFGYLIPGPKTIENRIPTAAITGLTNIDGSSKPGTSSGPIYVVSNHLTRIANSTHTLKFGGLFERAEQNNNDQIAFNQNGWFTFLDAGHPQSTGVALGNAALGNFDSYFEIGPAAYTLMRSNMIELFLQDTWRPAQNLTVEMGVRYSYQQPWYAKWNDISNFDPSAFDPSRRAVVNPNTGIIVAGDPYNGIVMPREGFPESARGRALGATLPNVDRLFRSDARGFVDAQKLSFSPRLGLAYRLGSRTVLRTGAGLFVHRQMLLNGTLFRNAPHQPRVDVQNGNSDALGAAGQLDFPFTIGALDLDYPYPSAWSYSFSVQRELPGAIAFEAAYVGKTGINLERLRNANQLQPGTTFANPNVRAVNALRPFHGLGIINENSRTGRSSYNSLQISADRRFSRGLGFGVAYTFSKCLDNTTTPYNAYNFVRALCASDRPHVLNVNFVYELPFYRSQKGAAGAVLGGWQLSGVTFFRSGSPMSVTDSTDTAGVGTGSAAQPWNVSGSTEVSGERGLNLPWFNTAAFSLPARGTFGNAGLNILRGPSFQNWDIALFKNIRIVERLSSQFRFEVFNFPNHPLLNNPGVAPRAGTFGLVTSKSGERNVQLGLKLIF